jgi:outer membrane immunogenic protein
MLAAAAVFVGGTSFASAADLSLKDTPYSPTPLAPVWSGMYIGGHLGGMTTNNGDVEAWKKNCYGEWEKLKHFEYDEGDEDVAFIGGVHVGYNWQRNSTVLGIEADASFADEVNYLASLRGRLGYASGSFLIYATAGVAFADFDRDGVKLGNKTLEGDDETDIGFVVGGGVEYKLRPNWSVGLEGLYYAFDDSDNEWAKRKFKITEETDGDFFVVRARLSYHFQSEAEIEPLK